MEPESEPRKPLLVFDGDCSFCRYCVDYGKSLTRDAVTYRPYQEVAPQFPEISIEQFRAAAQFMDRKGMFCSGAEAVFRALSYARGWRWLLWLYVRFRPFAVLSEVAYRWVAYHRNGLSRLLRLD